jgi:hypothetical protein
MIGAGYDFYGTEYIIFQWVRRSEDLLLRILVSYRISQFLICLPLKSSCFKILFARVHGEPSKINCRHILQITVE